MFFYYHYPTNICSVGGGKEISNIWALILPQLQRSPLWLHSVPRESRCFLFLSLFFFCETPICDYFCRRAAILQPASRANRSAARAGRGLESGFFFVVLPCRRLLYAAWCHLSGVLAIGPGFPARRGRGGWSSLSAVRWRFVFNAHKSAPFKQVPVSTSTWYSVSSASWNEIRKKKKKTRTAFGNA